MEDQEAAKPAVGGQKKRGRGRPPGRPRKRKPNILKYIEQRRLERGESARAPEQQLSDRTETGGRYRACLLQLLPEVEKKFELQSQFPSEVVHLIASYCGRARPRKPASDQPTRRSTREAKKPEIYEAVPAYNERMRASALKNAAKRRELKEEKRLHDLQIMAKLRAADARKSWYDTLAMNAMGPIQQATRETAQQKQPIQHTAQQEPRASSLVSAEGCLQFSEERHKDEKRKREEEFKEEKEMAKDQNSSSRQMQNSFQMRQDFWRRQHQNNVMMAYPHHYGGYHQGYYHPHCHNAATPHQGESVDPRISDCNFHQHFGQPLAIADPRYNTQHHQAMASKEGGPMARIMSVTHKYESKPVTSERNHQRSSKESSVTGHY